KIPTRASLNQPGAIERFYREARTAARLQHANICPIYDVGAVDGIYFLTMAYIVGKPISGLLTNQQRPLPEQAARLIRGLADGLEEAHQHGIIHRDLKPSNVMLNRHDDPIVLDFGLARQMNSLDDARLTRDGTVLGTLAYMPPEQAQGQMEKI